MKTWWKARPDVCLLSTISVLKVLPPWRCKAWKLHFPTLPPGGVPGRVHQRMGRCRPAWCEGGGALFLWQMWWVPQKSSDVAAVCTWPPGPPSVGPVGRWRHQEGLWAVPNVLYELRGHGDRPAVTVIPGPWPVFKLPTVG